MRILFVTNLWPDEAQPWRGPFVKRQADSLASQGVEIDALPIRGYAGRTAYLAAAARVIKLNRRPPYDVVHAHYGHSAAVARLQIRAPLVVTYWGSDLLGKRADSGAISLAGRVEAAALSRLAWVSAATITQSEEMEHLLPRRCRARNHVLPAGVDLQRFHPLPKQQAREQLGWANDEKVILFAGSPELPVKNYPLAEQVLERVVGQVPSARLRVAWGNPPAEMPIWMSAADVLLLPSRSEGSPNVVKEAMAAELPVVATPVGDVEALLRDVPGCYVRPADPQALAGAVIDALGRGRVPAAREAVAPLDSAVVARRMVVIYESVLRDRRRGSESHSPQRPGA